MPAAQNSSRSMQSSTHSGVAQGRSIRNICCIGGGYVGGPSGAVIANRAPHTKVTVVDINSERIAAWNSANLPVYEPYLHDLVVVARDGIRGYRQPNLFFSTDVDKAIKEADLIFVGVNTPTKTSGLGAGKASDLGWLEDATRRIARCAENETIVVEKSTVPCGTAQSMQEILEANAKPGATFEVLSNPEFLAEGTAISNLLYPDRILIGCFENDAGRSAASSLAEIYASWVPSDRIITMNLYSCELAKVAANALLAQRISSINALSAMCEELGANVEELSYACGLDSRIGSRMLNASVGFGGSCFKKDIMNLTYMAESLHLPEVAAYWKSVVDVNEWQKDRFTRRIVNSMHGTLARKKVAVLGFAYKKNTGDTRESAAISVVNNLLAENAIVAIFDPKVQSEQIYRDLDLDRDNRDRALICTDPYDACEDAHAVLVLTEWDMFSNKEPRLNAAPPGMDPALKEALGGNKAHPLNRREFNTPQVVLDRTNSDDEQSLGTSDSGGSEVESSSSQSSYAVKEDAKEISRLGIQPDQKTGTSTPMTYEKIDWSRVASLMQTPRYVFDGRNTIDRNKLVTLGFRVESVGSPSTGKHTGM
ncbi:hypothetical protein LTR70_004847 [Exophiala xenobiotica]|uniref:UDP-glucose 6-dehydrogenase n=1 Tax=Lithohypha guttulata TaxID=1690604 RepID=A0ABR0KC85_9EURO|nr:hypothetical protein LTR24_004465 [Lithohypha guttulata]KAK5319802.1 hypothetical protein LTR70_004847 [Exophiala xenobiotica]